MIRSIRSFIGLFGDSRSAPVIKSESVARTGEHLKGLRQEPDCRENSYSREAHVERRGDEIGNSDEGQPADHRDKSTLFFTINGKAGANAAPDQRRKERA